MKLTIQNNKKLIISYAEYINQSLYNPKSGYYMQKKAKIGRAGDFYTTASISSLFAEMMADYFIMQIKNYSIPPIFCEIGSGTGHFAQNFIETVKSRNPQLFKRLTYYSVEKSPYHLQCQKQRLDSSVMKYYTDLADIPTFSGIIFSNEWMDALPVHVITRVNEQLQEIMIENIDRGLSERLVPLRNKEILDYLKRFPQLQIKEGQRVEVPLAMMESYATVSSLLKSGLIITVDYGYTFDELKSPHLRDGTLRGYSNHRMITNILMNPTAMDITHHVHFEALIDEGRKRGMELLEFLRQDEFLLKYGILDKLVNHNERSPQSPYLKYNRAIRSLVEPGGISNYFHVLVQRVQAVN